MQYIQFQPQLPTDVTQPDIGNVNLFVDTITGTLLLKDSNGLMMSSSAGIAIAAAGTATPTLSTATPLGVGKRQLIIDTTNQSELLGWYLPTGSYDGQTVTILQKYDGGGTVTPTDVVIFMDAARNSSGEIVSPAGWYPFAAAYNSSNWSSMATAVYYLGAWTTDNNQFD